MVFVEESYFTVNGFHSFGYSIIFPQNVFWTINLSISKNVFHDQAWEVVRQVSQAKFGRNIIPACSSTLRLQECTFKSIFAAGFRNVIGIYAARVCGIVQQTVFWIFKHKVFKNSFQNVAKSNEMSWMLKPWKRSLSQLLTWYTKFSLGFPIISSAEYRI